MSEETDEEIYTYFNPELPEDFENLMSLLNEMGTKLGDLIVTVPVDMEVASPEDDILNVFGGRCLEIVEALEDILENENKNRKRLEEVKKLHDRRNK